MAVVLLVTGTQQNHISEGDDILISCNNHLLNRILNLIIFQPVGFVILVLGMFVYNDMIFLPLIRKHSTWIPEGW